MDVIELNGGRFYLRPLHDDDRIDDRPALSTIKADPDEFIRTARDSDHLYCWAICEQTSAEMIALGIYDHNTAEISVLGIGDLTRILPNDPVLPQKTVADAVAAGREVISRWVTAAL